MSQSPVDSALDPSLSVTQILVVDDERFFREVIGELLEAEGHAYQLAATASEALERAADPAVGVLILDIMLPDRNGLEVLREVRRTRPELRVVVLSAHTDQEYVLEALRLGACDYLAKPLHEEELRLSVRRALETYGLASDWSRLRTRLHAAGVELETLFQTTGEGLLSRALDAVERLLAARKVSVLLRGAGGDVLTVAAATGHKTPLEELDHVVMGQGVAGLVAARGEPLLVEDIAADERFRGPRPTHYTSSSFLAVPLRDGASCCGVLCATDREGGVVFSEEDLDLLRIVGASLGPALTPAEAPAPPPAEGPEAEAARAICDAMTREVDPGRLLGAALQAVGSSLDADLVSLYLLDGDSIRLRREAQWEGSGPGDREALPRDRGLSGAVFETGFPVASHEAATDPRFEAAVDSYDDGANTAPCLLLPLRFRGKSLGVVRIFAGAPRAASPKTAEVLTAALSAVVRNVLLYRSLVDSMEELADARRESHA